MCSLTENCTVLLYFVIFNLDCVMIIMGENAVYKEQEKVEDVYLSFCLNMLRYFCSFIFVSK